jgi:hypothetical protein
MTTMSYAAHGIAAVWIAAQETNYTRYAAMTDADKNLWWEEVKKFTEKLIRHPEVHTIETPHPEHTEHARRYFREMLRSGK